MTTIRNLQTTASLSLDKITINHSIEDKVLLNTICKRLAYIQANGRHPIQISSGQFYKFNCVIPIEISGGHFGPTVLLQIGCRRPHAADSRLEFNPSKMGSIGIAQLKEVLAPLDIDLAHILANGNTTRADTALDLWELTVDQVIARSDGHRKHAVYSNKHGLPESLYFGTPRSNRTVIYTKPHWDGRTSLRVERRIKKPFLFRDLAHIINPFAKVRLVSTLALEPHLDGMIPTQFFDSIRVRGFSHVVAHLPPRQCRTLTGILRDPERSLLPAMDDIWTGWPSLLADLFGEIPFAPAPSMTLVHGAEQSSETPASE